MTFFDNSLFDQHSGELGEFLAGLAASIAVAITVQQYFAAKNQRKFELADRLITELERNELLRFAVACIDWGGGLIPVPASWIAVIDDAVIEHDLDLLHEALRRDLTARIAADRQGMLYRHAFVALFDHLERIYFFSMQGAVRKKDLVSLSWLVRDLAWWPYAESAEFDPETFFMEAAGSWDEDGIPKQLIEMLNGAGNPMRQRRRSFQSLGLGKRKSSKASGANSDAASP